MFTSRVEVLDASPCSRTWASERNLTHRRGTCRRGTWRSRGPSYIRTWQKQKRRQGLDAEGGPRGHGNGTTRYLPVLMVQSKTAATRALGSSRRAPPAWKEQSRGSLGGRGRARQAAALLEKGGTGRRLEGDGDEDLARRRREATARAGEGGFWPAAGGARWRRPDRWGTMRPRLQRVKRPAAASWPRGGAGRPWRGGERPLRGREHGLLEMEAFGALRLSGRAELEAAGGGDPGGRTPGASASGNRALGLGIKRWEKGYWGERGMRDECGG